jgi:hypothetical protein
MIADEKEVLKVEDILMCSHTSVESKDFRKIPKTWVYFLIKGKDVVYVGQTKHGIKRIRSHSRSEFEWNKFNFLIVPQKDLLHVETIYIQRLKPIGNKCMDEAEIYSSVYGQCDRKKTVYLNRLFINILEDIEQLECQTEHEIIQNALLLYSSKCQKFLEFRQKSVEDIS